MQQKLLKTLSLQDQFMAYLQDKGRSINTVKNYKTDLQCFNHFLQTKTENTEIDQLPNGWQKNYASYLQERYNSDNSRRRRIQTLRLFFDFLKIKGVFLENPLKELANAPKFVDIPRPTQLIDVKTLWTFQLQESSQTSNSLEELITLRNQLITLLVYGAALKVSDIAVLKLSHILKDGTSARVLISSNKKRDPYTVPLPNIFLTVLESYLTLLEHWKTKSHITFDDLLFNANPFRILNGSLGPRGLELIFKEYSRKLSLTVTPKSLRQSCIFKWIHQSVPDSQIREWLGVTPAYDLNNYHFFAKEYLFNDEFLSELFQHYKHLN